MINSLVQQDNCPLEMQNAPGWGPIPRDGGGDIDLADYALEPSRYESVKYEDLL